MNVSWLTREVLERELCMSDRWLVFPKHLRRTDGAGLETEENIKRIKKAAADAFVKLLRQTWDIGAQINLVISINSFFFFWKRACFCVYENWPVF